MKIKKRQLLLVSLMMIFFGGFLANQVQSGFGDISVRDVRFAGTGGRIMSAYLFIPKNATAKKPAPGILAIHGNINSRETQSAFAIEYARRGWVVLEMDQLGHGYSDGPAYIDGYGSTDGLKFLRSLDIVDKNKIGIEGHSMGGWASVYAAESMPDGYTSMVLIGSSTGSKYGNTVFAPDGTSSFPRNLAVVFSTYDEFADLMWNVKRAKDVGKSEKLKKVFDSADQIKTGKIYGSIEQGTARILYQPVTTHPGVHFSTSAVGYSIDWFQKTLGEANPIPTGNQIWYWKEIFTLIAFLGGILLIFSAGGILLDSGFFRKLKGLAENQKPATGASWWAAAALSVLLPGILYLPLVGVSYDKFVSWLFPQLVTNCIMAWSLGCALISVILFSLWHLTSNKKKGANLASYGIAASNRFSFKTVGLSVVFALTVLGSLYASLALIAGFFNVDFRFWIVALKPLNRVQFEIVLRYIMPFTVFFVISAMTLNGQLRLKNAGLSKRMAVNAALSSASFILFSIIMYTPLFVTGTIPLAFAALFPIVGLPFIPVLAVTGLITTFFYEKTGQVWSGAFINSVFITWYIVAGQSTSFPVF